MDEQSRLDRAISRLGQVWDWFDKRDIDKHAAFWAVAYCSWEVVLWAMTFFADHSDIDPLKASAIITSVVLPMTGVQTLAFKWYFESRPAGA